MYRDIGGHLGNIGRFNQQKQRNAKSAAIPPSFLQFHTCQGRDVLPHVPNEHINTLKQNLKYFKAFCASILQFETDSLQLPALLCFLECPLKNQLC